MRIVHNHVGVSVIRAALHDRCGHHDAIFPDILDGYDGALYLGLGRVIDLSVSMSRLILSGLMERHPLGSQAFFPLGEARYAVIVAPPPPRDDLVVAH